jgi:hypothetical protein
MLKGLQLFHAAGCSAKRGPIRLRTDWIPVGISGLHASVRRHVEYRIQIWKIVRENEIPSLPAVAGLVAKPGVRDRAGENDS